MRDWKIQIIENQGLDIDIINGEPVYLPYEPQTYDQRASLSCYMSKGTIPGALDLGISWGDNYTQDNTVLQLSNECQQAVDRFAGSAESDSSTASSGYNAQLITSGGETGVLITRR